MTLYLGVGDLFLEGPRVITLGLVGHITFVLTTQFCCFSGGSHRQHISKWVWPYSKKCKQEVGVGSGPWALICQTLL